MRQRRRAERQLLARSTAQGSAARRGNQRRTQLLLYAGGALLLAGIIVMLGVGWFLNSYSPPRKVVAEFDGVEFRLSEVEAYARLDGVFAGAIDVGLALNNLLRDHVLAARGDDIGASVGQEDIDRALVQRFETPDPNADPEAPPPAQLTEAGRETFEEFIDAVGVTENEYLRWQEGQLRRDAAQQSFLDDAPLTAESVFIEWIVGSDSVQAQIAYDRIAAGEDFTAVANEMNTDFLYADTDGVVGWTPRGIVPEIDDQLESGELTLGEAHGPIATLIGSVVYRVTEESESQPVDDGMRRLLAQNAFQEWLDAQAVGAASHLTREDIDWVTRTIGAG